MKIDYPSKKEKNETITSIIEAGMTLPQNKSLMRILKTILRLDRQVIFWDMGSLLVLSTLLMLTLFFSMAIFSPPHYYSTALVLSPLVYLTFVGIMQFTQSYSPLNDIEKTSKLTLHELNAYRLILFSLFGMGACLIVGGISLVAWQVQSLISILLLMLAGLFLCAYLSILVSRRSPKMKGQVLFITGWLSVNGLIMTYYGTQWESLLSNIPYLVSGLLALIFMGLYGNEIRQLLRKGVKYYAYN